ncbi:MAG: DUF2800 domain-containing protein [Verrucomicrobia bacterium]|jgi:hypothetical protein|nr:DUF2800 domain-containing protein [Verrucomicrobiota bacterium]
MIRPSSLPALAQCPSFESGSSEYAEDGTERHHALTEHFAGDDSRLELMDDEQAEGVRWAAEYIKIHAPMSDFPIDFEKKMSFTDADLNEVEGTPDVVCGNHLFDLKWRYRDYTAQMAAYALMMFQGAPRETVTVHLLFGATKRAQAFNLTEESCRYIIDPIIERARNPDRVPEVCDYCGWCKLKLTCPAFKVRVDAVLEGRDDWHLETYTTDFVTDGKEMAKALRLARRIKKWCEAVEWRAKELWQKEGVQIPDFEMKERQAKQYITNVIEAFRRSGLPQDKFLECCEPRLNTSKTYPDKLGLIDTYHGSCGGSKAGAKKELLRKLESVLKRGNTTVYLVDTGSKTEEESE